jgi:transcriptional regulator with XRE-family HTH domain
VQITFKELRERYGISLAQVSRASYIFISQIRQFEESNEIFLDQLDAILLAFSNLVGKRFTRKDIYYIPQLRFRNHEQPYEGPLPERPALRKVIEHYQLSPHLIALAADVSFRDVEEMMIGRPVEREKVEEVLKVISLYIRNRHGAEVINYDELMDFAVQDHSCNAV